MKKLRMIVTSVIVLAIVGSAFAFNAKKVAVFCTSTNDGNSACETVTFDKYIDPTNGTNTRYFNGWDGRTSTCTAGGNTNCPSTSTVPLSNN